MRLQKLQGKGSRIHPRNGNGPTHGRTERALRLPRGANSIRC